MNDTFSLDQFFRRFKDDQSCLEEIKNLRWPSGVLCIECKKVTKYYKLEGRTSYSCEFCRTQVFPLAGTIFEKTSTPLRLWFYAMFIMVQTRSGVSAMQLQRELGVTYKTAWRMFKQIRLLMSQNGGDMLKGIVEVEETDTVGAGKNRREVGVGWVENTRKAYLKHVPNSGKWTLVEQIKDHIDPTARVITDRYDGYMHEFVTHTKSYVLGDMYTQNAENIWSIVKRGIYGVYRVVSKKYLQAYIDEYAWRYNNRKSPTMFDDLLRQVVTVMSLGSAHHA